MKRSPQEKQALREQFRKMTAAQKADYIYTYFKWPILLGLIVLLILGNGIYRQLTRKDPAVYLGLVNVSVGPDLEAALTAGYLEYAGLSPEDREVQVYTGLYLSEDASTENHQYAYASRMKVMAAINARELDVVLMNREAYDNFSQNGYLLPLSGLSPALEPYLAENEVVLEDNSIEVQLGEADEYKIVTEVSANAMEITQLPLFREAAFPASVYAGIIANTPRQAQSLSYLNYLLANPRPE